MPNRDLPLLLGRGIRPALAEVFVDRVGDLQKPLLLSDPNQNARYTFLARGDVFDRMTGSILTANHPRIAPRRTFQFRESLGDDPAADDDHDAGRLARQGEVDGILQSVRFPACRRRSCVLPRTSGNDR